MKLTFFPYNLFFSPNQEKTETITAKVYNVTLSLKSRIKRSSMLGDKNTIKRCQFWNAPYRYYPAIDAKTFEASTFLMNRFCRLAPIYWLVNLIMLVAENDYYDDDIYEKYCGLYILLTFSCTNTWFFNPWGQPYPIHPISNASWTVNTLFFFYLTLPTLLKLLKPLSDKSIARLIVLLCLFQSIPFYVVWEFYSADLKVNVTVK